MTYRFLVFALIAVCVYANPFRHLRERANFHGVRENYYSSSCSLDAPTLPPNFKFSGTKTLFGSDGTLYDICNMTVAVGGKLALYSSACINRESTSAVYRGDLVVGVSPEPGPFLRDKKPLPAPKIYITTYEYTSGSGCKVSSSKNAFLYMSEVLNIINDFYREDLYFYDHSVETIDGMDYLKLFSQNYVNSLIFNTTLYLDFDLNPVKVIAERFENEERVVYEMDIDFEFRDKEVFKIDEKVFGTCENPTLNHAPGNVSWGGVLSFSDMLSQMECGMTVDLLAQGLQNNETRKLAITMEQRNKIVAAYTVNGMKTIYRGDFPGATDSNIPSFIGDNESCSIDYTSMIGLQMIAVQNVPFIFGDLRYSSTEEVTCGTNESCTMYCGTNEFSAYLGGAQICVVMKADSSFPVQATISVSPEVIKYNSISFEVDPTEFIMNKSEYPGCPNETFYYEPKDCEIHDNYYYVSSYFTPTRLPCSFTIFSKESVEGNGDNYKCNVTYSKTGNAAVRIRKYDDDTPDELTLIRGDITTASYHVSKFEFYGSCDIYTGYTLQGAFKDFETSYLFFTASHYYNDKENVTIDGVDYVVYTEDSGSYTNRFYVDKNGYVVRIEQDSEYNGQHNYTFEYDFGEIDANLFKVDDTTKQKCNLDELGNEWSVAPSVKSCNYFYPAEYEDCSYSVEITKKQGVEEPVKTKYYVAYPQKNEVEKNKNPVFVIESNESRAIHRGDFVIKDTYNTGIYFNYYEVNDTYQVGVSCPGYFSDVVQNNFNPIGSNGFMYVSEVEVPCGGNQCIKYCLDEDNTTCVTALKSQPQYMVRYQFIEHYSDMDTDINFSVPEKIYNLHMFKVDESKFPKCQVQHAKACKDPEFYCITPKPDDPKPDDPQTPTVLSSASVVNVCIATLLSAIALIFLF